LPVVARENPRQLLGVIRRNDIVHAYDMGVMRRDEARQRADVTHVVNHAHAEFVEVRIPTAAQTANHTIAELNLPRTSVLVSIRRGRELVIPHGDTRIECGDVVTALCQPECVNQVREELIKMN
jgi:CIC family chloride channel protein